MTRSNIRWRRCVAVLLAAAVVQAASIRASAQTRIIQGTVVDEDGRPVTGATVEAAIVSLADVDFAIQRTDRTWKAVTDLDGGYIITVPRTGEYLVTATKDGFGGDRRKVVVQRSGMGTATLTLWKERPATTGSKNCIASPSNAPSTSSVLTAGADPGLTRLTGWIQAVQMHTPGCADFSAFDIDRWPVRDLAILLRDIRSLVTFLQRVEGQPDAQRDRLTFSIYSRRFTVDELQRSFFANEPLRSNDLLRRGAVLHADIGILGEGNLGQYPLVQDGGRRGWQGGSAQWDVARQLLDAIAPPADPGALLWYRAVSAHFFHDGNLAELASHLSKGRQVFPQSAELWFDSGCLHQELSSPAIQASVRELRANNVGVAVGSRADELQRAERFFRQALTLAPDHVRARLRFGHTLGELGRHAEAATELQQVLAATPDRPHEYLALLFLGRAQEARARTDEARRYYQRAADLYPAAQSPRLALSRLAQHSGDRAGAQDAVRLLSARSNPAQHDPWWDFYEAHKNDAADLMAELHRLARGSGF